MYIAWAAPASVSAVLVKREGVVTATWAVHVVEVGKKI
jgi:hypothetical protein